MCLGVPGKVVEFVDLDTQQAIVEVEGVRREIAVSLLGLRTDDGAVHAIGDVSGDEAVAIGDWVLVHVGFAMSKIDEVEARETLQALKMFSGAFDEEMLEFASQQAGMDPLGLFEQPPPRVDAADPPG